MLLADTCPSWLYGVKSCIRDDHGALGCPPGRMAACNLGWEDNGSGEWYPSTIMQMVQWGFLLPRRVRGLKTEEDIRHFIATQHGYVRPFLGKGMQILHMA